MQTTVGQVLINSVLPAHLRDYNRVLDKKGVKDLLEQVAQEGDAELYRDVIHALHQVGQQSAQSTGSSFSIYDLLTPPKTKRMMDALRAKVTETVERSDLTEEQKEAAVKNMVMKAAPRIDETLFAETKAMGNPFATQVISGSRGGLGDLRSMLVGGLMVTGHKDRLIPAPMLTSFAAGTDPFEYWAGAYGARKGTISSKLATARTGFFGKQMVQAAHRQVVTEDDCETDRGIPVDADDPDNIGTVLIQPVGSIPSGTVIDPRIARQLKRATAAKKDKTVYVRSPLTCEAKHGVCSRCVGIRERGDFPEIGDNVGVAAAQSLSERLSQGSLNVKHTGGRVRGGEIEGELTGFPLINQLVQVPKSFRGGAAVARMDGTVKEVRPAPQGGTIVVVGDEEHFAPPGLEVTVKSGDRVEAGDMLSKGLPNPADLVRYKGVGAGRLDFMRVFQNAYKKSGMSPNRRNIELLTRGLINHVRVTELDGIDNALPDDIVEYTTIERNYRPRYGFRVLKPTAAVGSYLERPIHQYSIGTRITKKVSDDLHKRGVKELTVHTDPPPFEPEMVRAMQQMTVIPDWQVRLGGSYLQRGLMEALHRGRTSKVRGVSYVPALARSKGFGEELEEKGVY